MEGGVPESPDSWDVVRAEEITVYVPRDKSYEEDVPRIVHFRKGDNERVGVVNEL